MRPYPVRPVPPPAETTPAPEAAFEDLPAAEAIPQAAGEPEAAPPGEAETGLLFDRVLGTLEARGAQAQVDTRHENRAILSVQAAGGEMVTVMVDEGTQPVDVAEVRALFALINNSGSAGGYLIAAAPFTQKAYDWASARKIRLVRADELDELSI